MVRTTISAVFAVEIGKVRTFSATIWQTIIIIVCLFF